MHSQVHSYELWVKTVRAMARVGSLFVVVLVLLFIFGEGNSGMIPIRGRDIAGLALFPGSVVGGMIVAWRYELEGSLFSIGSLIGFYVLCGLIGGNLPSGWAFIAFTSPAFLFLLSGIMEKFKAHGGHALRNS